MNPSTRLARDVVTALRGARVTEVVLAPGSRNAPLSFALYDAAQAGGLRLHTRMDERTAAFLALGLAKVSGRPAAVCCTSGTAVANLLPAVVEAAHAAVPLVVVTADRPARLRGTGANQTTDQAGIFGEFAPTLDVAAADLDDLLAFVRSHEHRRPVHLNVQLDDPLLPDDGWDGGDVPAWAATAAPRAPRPLELALGPRTVVVAGDDAGPPARQLAESAGWPLLAEPSSGCRTGDAVVRTYRLLLGGDLGRRVERVVVLGHPTLSRPVSRLLARGDVEVVSVRPRGMWATRPFPVAVEVDAHDGVRAAGTDDAAWLEEWRLADRSVSRGLDRLLAAEPDLTPYEVAGAVSRALPPGGLLVVGASNPIRDLDLMVAPYEVGGRRKVIANRGLAGIDGTVSTAIGAALGRPRSTRALALMGDVTFLHDTTGLFLGPREERPDLTLVVVNDDGGSIFATLEQGAPEHADRFDTLFGTPHGVDVASLCAAARVPHLRVTGLPELEQALASPNGGIEVVEARVRRDNRADLDTRIRALAP
ncbi:2-succinyl-5-enolpyruvyl-6-hydroxy-3-cyclohexene-1-carboxylic-acid synthase [Nocardioides sp. zg-1228]|uniref:2-succinyl-5-enolpyruvyl-6-hydroxy-3- cyclohexene-1-carboxylic-acid synthase n=1 Tax=Nocardioides sp. zg-1228 TaxID=2763008 RepID=UPI0016427F43|nr:2-succinyl-5-enolpyruvyl-6-hydroxy-3-cyclohexene-1-carboxylic-acid synthase [Nocardioides sp. zg-1228]MBC2932681.1 2-succinyl-5-enolpyruvyl-6-hydroxy-3-cyclohexene-1-carboxylic-acid synthase [Nocardioides sp. zg-1228]QSF58163.1 2-succinyl-5-enolpyruvyl-6-hydroxy-3-cyclohexene-1-carboxylic-acid synthase [Nocardioides sp. zg-1228]